MHYTVILNSSSKSNKLNFIRNKIATITKELPDVILDSYILKDGIALDSDSNLILNILMHEFNRTPLILDYDTACIYPELVKTQQSIILMDVRDDKIDNLKLDSLISFGAQLDFITDEITNDKISVVDINRFIVKNDFYTSLYYIYKKEHNKFPTTLLPRETIIRCNGNIDILMDAYANRLNYKSYIGWSSAITNIKDFKYTTDVVFENIAIKDFSDKRLINETNEQIVFSPKRL